MKSVLGLFVLLTLAMGLLLARDYRDGKFTAHPPACTCAFDPESPCTCEPGACDCGERARAAKQ